MPSLLVTGFQVLISEDYVLHSMLTHWYYRLTIQVNCTSSSLNLSHEIIKFSLSLLSLPLHLSIVLFLPQSTSVSLTVCHGHIISMSKQHESDLYMSL